MNNAIDIIDHIVYCTHDLTQGISDIESITGIKAIYGGRHLNRGTHNANIKIGPNSYLEILALDPDNKNVKAPRWMGIDLIDNPKITSWAIKSSDIISQAKILQNYNAEYGSVQSGERALADGSLLKWSLTDPLSKPDIEVIPFLLDWQDSIHPTVHMDQLCSIVAINLNHPKPESLSHFLNKMNYPAASGRGITVC